ncbi:NADH dehydrogenase [uncultured Candidatus Thioglobus sp.]|nr:NADH dehydrogenase [uncultured Candidatus Thioglobus sp.]
MMKKILIIGGGFGGVFTAKYLLKALPKSISNDVQIELISQHNYFVFQPLLPEVSSGIINPHDAVSPLRTLIPKIKHRLARVQYIDTKNNKVQVLQGRNKKLIEIEYDQLVIACGQKSQLNLPGFAQHSFSMQNLSDAFLLRNHVLKCLELADVTLDKKLKQHALTFVTAGAGFSGVETLGELQDMVKRALKYYPNISLNEAQFILLQRGERILEQLPESLSAYAHKKLLKRGVDIRLHTGVARANRDYIETSEGEKIHTLTTITTIGSAPLDFIQRGFELQRGKIEVNTQLQVLGHSNIWALGDAALIPMHNTKGETEYAPPTAQFAVREAKNLAYNLSQHLTGKTLKPFKFNPLGVMASLGAYQGVAQIYKLRLSGIVAWAMWRALYITKVPGNIAKIRITLNWVMDYFFPRTLVQIDTDKNELVEYMHFSKGDVICQKEEVIGYFYLIVSGSVLCENEQGSHTLKSQQHFGADKQKQKNHHDFQISALEQTKLLCIPWQNFALLRQDFKQFDGLFE